jgi:hypothetical protein
VKKILNLLEFKILEGELPQKLVYEVGVVCNDPSRVADTFFLERRIPDIKRSDNDPNILIINKALFIYFISFAEIFNNRSFCGHFYQLFLVEGAKRDMDSKIFDEDILTYSMVGRRGKDLDIQNHWKNPTLIFTEE